MRHLLYIISLLVLVCSCDSGDVEEIYRIQTSGRTASLTASVSQWEPLPAGYNLSLAAYPVSYFTKMMKSSMLEVMDSDYVRTAKAKGCGHFLMTYKHALKNALLPIVTSLGPMFAGTMTGSFVVEKIFTIPGLGEQFTKSIFNRDYPMIMGLTIFYSVLLIAFVLIADIANAIIDPRIKLEGESS